MTYKLNEDDTDTAIVKNIVQANTNNKSQNKNNSSILNLDSYIKAIYDNLNINNKEVITNNESYFKKGRNGKFSKNPIQLDEFERKVQPYYESSDKNQKLLLLKLLIYRCCNTKDNTIDKDALFLLRNSSDILGTTDKNKVLYAVFMYVNSTNDNNITFDFVDKLISAYNDGTNLDDLITVKRIHDSNDEEEDVEYSAEDIKNLIRSGKKFSSFSNHDIMTLINSYKKSVKQDDFNKIMFSLFSTFESSSKK